MASATNETANVSLFIRCPLYVASRGACRAVTLAGTYTAGRGAIPALAVCGGGGHSPVMQALPEIPFIDVGTGGALKLLEAERVRAEELIAITRRNFTGLALRVGDRFSRAWLERSANPYRAEILAIADSLGVAGAVMLNLSFEWTCTTGAAPSPDGHGNRMLRVLDWRLRGLGKNVVVAREEAPAGVFYNVTWPGAVAVLTAMAPGRFSAAINQAPMRRHGRTIVGDWATNRARVWRSSALPPAHLLRRVFEAAHTYHQARHMLTTVPLALPVLFILSGARPEDGCVIERTETDAVIHDGAQACANEWRSQHLSGRLRGRDNPERRLLMEASHGRPTAGFDWVRPPILNRFTRLAVEANAAQGTLRVIGYEREAPATAEFRLSHAGLAAAQRP
jgi:hypothetical protein